MRQVSLRDMADWLEIYGLPMRLGYYRAGAEANEKSVLYRAVRDLGRHAAGIMPEGMRIELLAAAEGQADPFMTMVERDGTPLTVTGQNHNNHFMIDSENPMTVTVGRPVMDSPIDYQTGILIYFTQIGDGPVILEPLPAGDGFPAVELIWPENSSPQTYGKGATIGIESRNETQWIVTGHLGI
jgi:hypothetical protein